MATKQKPQKGDLIEFFRGTYQHWAVYIDDGYVVHLTENSDAPGSGIWTLALANQAIVKKEKLKGLAGDDEWRVNNILDDKYKHRPGEDIVEDALKLVGDTQEYNVFTSNCEHFATDIRYGEAESQQAKEAPKRVVKVLGLLVRVALGR